MLDHFGLEQVTLLGISLGGGLAIRAAAGEPRIARVISDDILTDFLACNLRQFPARVRTVVTALLRLRASRLMNAQQAEAALARSFLAGLPPEVTRELQAEAERADYPVGTTVYRPGSPPQAALVVSDLIRVYLTSPEGRQVTVRTPGQVTCWGWRYW